MYTGFSVKEEKSTKKGKKRYVQHGALFITSIYLLKNVNEIILKLLDLSRVSFKLMGQFSIVSQ